MICGHGSRSQGAVREFANLAEQIQPLLPEWPVEYGYLEFANPVIRDGLDALRNRGCNQILAVPGMLFAAMHVKNDIPSVLNTYAGAHGIDVFYGRELGIDPKLLEASRDRIFQAMEPLERNGSQVPLTETCLIVIGRGCSDPDANSNVTKLARLLWEGTGFGWCEVGYSGVTFPLVKPCLEHALKLGYRRIVVFPYFLFSGILIDRIYGFTDLVAAAHPEVEFVKAGYLGDHPNVAQVFAERAREILSGHTAMNCSMCKYRSKVLGFESEVGSPQVSHHHHVEGQGASAPGSNVEACLLCDTFCTGACRLDASCEHHHDHDQSHVHHHHPPYPHATHPLGPHSVRKLLQDSR